MGKAGLAGEIEERIRGYREEITGFAREMIRIPSESCRERPVIERIKAEMDRVGFEEINIDPLGNILGRMGRGPRVIAYDAHIDTVGIGNIEEWEWDPYRGKIEDGVIYGRGACDQEGAMASMVYAARIIKEMDLYREFSLYFVGSVQEEDCDGLCWQYILNEDRLEPEMVVITEPTNLNIYRGHRGRMEMEVITEGVSCHGSAPERGENSIYKMAPVISGIEELNERLKDDPFLGKGSIAVTHITNQTPSLCAVPDRTAIHLDRRLTAGEDKEKAVREVEELIARLGIEARAEVLHYAEASYTGLVYPVEKYYPTWLIPEDHRYVQAAAGAYRSLFGKEPEIGNWTFSTNGVAVMGRHGIPCIGFGPADEVYAHSVRDQVPVEHLMKAAAFYALYPSCL